MCAISFPNQAGRLAGAELISTQIVVDELPLVQKAISNYSTYSRGMSEKKFIKTFENFAKQWRDWVDYKPERTSNINLIPLKLEDIQ